MRILALETSARAASAAILEDGVLLCMDYQDTGLTHSRTLMPMVEHLLRTAGFRPRDMDAFAVSAGPGSFTGVRIGVAAAKGLAFGADRPVIGVSTLAAMAWNVHFLDGLTVCAMDARRSQVYNALFLSRSSADRDSVNGDGLNQDNTPNRDNGSGNRVPVRLTEDRAVSLADLSADLAEPGRIPAAAGYERIVVVGDGARLCVPYLREHGIPCEIAPPQLVMQSAAGVALEAEVRAAAGQFLTAGELRPFYLRPPSALPLRERMGQKG